MSELCSLYNGVLKYGPQQVLFPLSINIKC